MLVPHLPGRSGSSADYHIQLFVPARQLTGEGFGANAGKLVHDQGFREIVAAWGAWQGITSDAQRKGGAA